MRKRRMKARAEKSRGGSIWGNLFKRHPRQRDGRLNTFTIKFCRRQQEFTLFHSGSFVPFSLPKYSNIAPDDFTDARRILSPEKLQKACRAFR